MKDNLAGLVKPHSRDRSRNGAKTHLRTRAASIAGLLTNAEVERYYFLNRNRFAQPWESRYATDFIYRVRVPKVLQLRQSCSILG